LRLRFAKALTYFSLIRAILRVPLVPFDHGIIVVPSDHDDDLAVLVDFNLPNFLASRLNGPDCAGYVPSSKSPRAACHGSCIRLNSLMGGGPARFAPLGPEPYLGAAAIGGDLLLPCVVIRMIVQ